MQTECVIAAITTKIKEDLHKHAESLRHPLTAENAENVIHLLYTAALASAGEGFKTYLLQHESKKTL